MFTRTLYSSAIVLLAVIQPVHSYGMKAAAAAAPSIPSSALPQIHLQPKSFKLLQTLQIGRCVQALNYNPQQNSLVICCKDEPKIRIWAPGTDIQLTGHILEVSLACYSPDGRLLASFSADDALHIWDLSSRSPILTLEQFTGPVLAVAFSPDQKRLMALGKQGISQWDLFTGASTDVLPLALGATVFAGCISPDLSLIAYGTDSLTPQNKHVFEIVLVEPKNPTQALKKLTGHESTILCLSFNTNNCLLASGSDDKTIKLWNLASGTCMQTLKGHNGAIRSLCFSPDGRTIATGSDDAMVKIWDVSNGACLLTLPGHMSAVYAVKFSSDGRTLASGSGDYTVKMWQVSESAPVGQNASGIPKEK